ncbi:MAG: DinB family protein [Bacteroidota bacterium]
MANSDNLQTSLEILQTRLSELINFYQSREDHTRMVYTHWSAKDILGHLTFWHESFARNISDLGTGRQPQPLKGKLSEVNAQSVASTAHESIDALIERLRKAQQIIETHIHDEKIGLIPYKKGSRPYERREHLDVVAGHIKRHLKDLKKKPRTQK